MRMNKKEVFSVIFIILILLGIILFAYKDKLTVLYKTQLSKFEMKDEAGNPFPYENLPGRRIFTGEKEPEETISYLDKKSGKIVEKEYYNISFFSLFKNKEKIIEMVKKHHSDKCPIVAFFEMDGNQEFLDWIKESVK